MHGALKLCIAKMGFALSTFTCFISCAQFCSPGTFTLVQKRMLRHNQEVFLSQPIETWDVFNSEEIFCPLPDCDDDVSKMVAAVTRVCEVK